MSLAIWKKIAAVLSVACLCVVLNGCGPAAETPTPGEAPPAETSEETGEGEDDETIEDEPAGEETESEGQSIE